MLHSLPVNDPVSAVMHNMDARNVDTVLVAGRIVKQRGTLIGVDLPRLIQRLYDSRDRLFREAGLGQPAPETARL
jgi:5-methylthioadenosine/S-adenosylhomocysteine deaminase